MIPTWQIMIRMWQNRAKPALPGSPVAVRWGDFRVPLLEICKPLAFRRRDAVASSHYADGEIRQSYDMGL